MWDMWGKEHVPETEPKVDRHCRDTLSPGVAHQMRRAVASMAMIGCKGGFDQESGKRGEWMLYEEQMMMKTSLVFIEAVMESLSCS